MVDTYFQYINQLSVACMLICGGLLLIRSKSDSLHVIISTTLTAATIPTGPALFICAFSPMYIQKLADLHIHLALAGLVLLILAVFTIRKGFEDIT